MIEEAKNKYSSARINSIVESVGRDLSDSIDEIVSAGMSGGSDALSNIISEITRSSLISNIKTSMGEIRDDIIDDFSIGLSDLNSTMSDLTLSDSWITDVSEAMKKMFDGASSGLNDIIKERQGDPQSSDTVYKAITTVLAVTTTVLNPVLELIIVFLPNIISSFFDSMQEDKKRAQIKQAVLTNAIPALKRELRKNLPEIFNAQVNKLILSIGEQFESVIKEKQASIENAQREIGEKNSDIDKTIQIYKGAAETITAMANDVLYKG